MIHGATLLLLKYKLPYILHDPRNGATLILLKYKLPYILHDPRNGATLLLLNTNYLISDIIHEMQLPYSY